MTYVNRFYGACITKYHDTAMTKYKPGQHNSDINKGTVYAATTIY